MVNKGIIIIVLGIAVLGSVVFALPQLQLEQSGSYKPGSIIHMRIPSSGLARNLVGEPMFVRYYLRSPSGDVAHSEDHDVTYKNNDILTSWEFYDEHDVTIGAFAEAGMWSLEGELHSSYAIIELPSIPLLKTFYVESGTIIDNILAPIYLHGDHPLTFLFGAIDITLPPLIFPIMLIVVLIVVIIIRRKQQESMIEQAVKKGMRG